MKFWRFILFKKYRRDYKRIYTEDIMQKVADYENELHKTFAAN